MYELLSLTTEDNTIAIDYFKPANEVFWHVMPVLSRYEACDIDRIFMLGIAMGVTGREAVLQTKDIRSCIELVFGCNHPLWMFANPRECLRQLKP